MNKKEKIKELQTIIRREVTPLITSDYVLWGLPYYPNIGDTLIWEGEIEFLKAVPYKCLDTCGWDGYRFKPLGEDVTILITGGGYFGDVWRKAWDNVMDTIEHYPNNRIVILPNTIFYNDADMMRSDAKRLSKLKKLVICVRDNVSYDIATKNFKNEVRLVPDMAFCIKESYLRQWEKKETNRILYLKRKDKELVDDNIKICGDSDNIEVRDWPTMDGKPTMTERIFSKISSYSCSSILQILFGQSLLRKLEAFYAYHFYRKCMTRQGVGFVSRYRKVYTTRLHVMILSVLLGKKVHFIDNSYGKLSSFYNAWLTDCDEVDAYQNDNP